MLRLYLEAAAADPLCGYPWRSPPRIPWVLRQALDGLPGRASTG
ncbi:hypothetical protein Daudx_2161 [Candidatus Desulforudis audaxviator]|nr:hypothetical protein Daudx_2161 [Candidatus Desulforudis audaxviator]